MSNSLKSQSILLLVAVVLFGYQNCSQDYKNSWDGNYSNTNKATSGTTQTQQPAKSFADKVSFFVQPNTTLSKTADSISFPTEPNKLVIDLFTGVMEEITYNNQFVNRYCLPSAILQNMNSLLEQKLICKKGSLATDQICAQVMKMPYAALIKGSDVLELGMATDSCGSNSVDLCEDGSDLLKSLNQKIQKEKSTYICR